jgi:deoxyribodipyrimidine photo-lyase
MISKYDRNKDFPYLNATSHIGIHLRFGTVSIRQCVEEAVKVIDNSWLEGLIWRDFFTQILYHFPQVENHSFKSIYDNIEWKNNIEFYKKWIDGQTGVALVDAGMRELNATGFMNNQVRMITASFLCKNLHISWKWGERYFSKKLLDYDLALNVGNWQWIAGNGADASPYFKVFNPKVQMETYDSLNNYVKKWVPEYKSENYKPIINFEQSRNECFDLYKKALINKQ